MKKITTGLSVAALMFVSHAMPAAAIDAYDCTQTLRGNSPHVGYHGSDNDVYARWQHIEATRGVDIVQSWAFGPWNIDGRPTKIGIQWAFLRANGALIIHAFRCDDGRPYGQGYTDDYWFYVSG